MVKGACSGACDGSGLASVVALAAEVRALRQDVAALRQAVEGRCPSRLSKPDVNTLARLLPVVAAEYGSRNFVVKELLAAPAPGVKLVLGDVSSRRLGKLLARGEGTVIGGFVIEKLGSEGHAAIWRVVGVVPGVSNSSAL